MPYSGNLRMSGKQTAEPETRQPCFPERNQRKPLIKAIGKQLVCVHVNHGLMRKNESESVIKMFKDGMDANLIYVDATDHFLNLLAGVSDPERKRKIIGKEFITVFADKK